MNDGVVYDNAEDVDQGKSRKDMIERMHNNWKPKKREAVAA